MTILLVPYLAAGTMALWCIVKNLVGQQFVMNDFKIYEWFLSSL